MRLPFQSDYPTIGDLVDDLKTIFAPTPNDEIRTITAQYIDGLTLALPKMPIAIELINCVRGKSPGVPTGFGSAVEWIWTGAGARILRIEGLSVGETTYTLTIRVTYG
jgi:hypothetical protein